MPLRFFAAQAEHVDDDLRRLAAHMRIHGPHQMDVAEHLEGPGFSDVGYVCHARAATSTRPPREGKKTKALPSNPLQSRRRHRQDRTMDFSLSPEQEQIRDEVRKLCAQFDDAYWLEKDRTGDF